MKFATTNSAVCGAVLAALRIGAGLCQREIAATLGRDQSGIARFEAGTATPTPEQLSMMLAAYGWTLSDYDTAVDAAKVRLRAEDITVVDKGSTDAEFHPVGRSTLLQLVTGSSSARAAVRAAPACDETDKPTESEEDTENAEIADDVPVDAVEDASAGSEA
jgi:transcriptional regulator with XRE-family HTH domain